MANATLAKLTKFSINKPANVNIAQTDPTSTKIPPIASASRIIKFSPGQTIAVNALMKLQSSMNLGAALNAKDTTMLKIIYASNVLQDLKCRKITRLDNVNALLSCPYLLEECA